LFFKTIKRTPQITFPWVKRRAFKAKVGGACRLPRCCENFKISRSGSGFKLNEDFCCFPQSLQANSIILPRIIPRLLPFISP